MPPSPKRIIERPPVMASFTPSNVANEIQRPLAEQVTRRPAAAGPAVPTRKPVTKSLSLEDIGIMEEIDKLSYAQIRDLLKKHAINMPVGATKSFRAGELKRLWISRRNNKGESEAQLLSNNKIKPETRKWTTDVNRTISFKDIPNIDDIARLSTNEMTTLLRRYAVAIEDIPDRQKLIEELKRLWQSIIKRKNTDQYNGNPLSKYSVEPEVKVSEEPKNSAHVQELPSTSMTSQSQTTKLNQRDMPPIRESTISLDDILDMDNISKLTMRQMKTLLQKYNVPFNETEEKTRLTQLVENLWRSEGDQSMDILELVPRSNRKLLIGIRRSFRKQRHDNPVIRASMRPSGSQSPEKVIIEKPSIQGKQTPDSVHDVIQSASGVHDRYSSSEPRNTFPENNVTVKSLSTSHQTRTLVLQNNIDVSKETSVMSNNLRTSVDIGSASLRNCTEDSLDLCRVCMSLPINCVLVECGHMVTCSDCGYKITVCPVCRGYVVGIVHTLREDSGQSLDQSVDSQDIQSLQDISSEDMIEELSNDQIKAILNKHKVSTPVYMDRTVLVGKLKALFRNFNRLAYTSGENTVCKICMLNPIDCVLVECGHLVVCTECAYQTTECPICKQYIEKVIRTYKA